MSASAPWAMPTATLGDRESGILQLGNPAQGALEPARLEHGERVVLGHEHAVEDEVVTSRAAQPRHGPGVDDVDVARREHHHPQRRHAAVVDDAVGDEPVSVLAPAGERPTAACLEAVLDDGGRAGRVERPGTDHVGTVGVDHVECGWRQFAEEHRCRTADHHRPADRPVDAGQLTDELQVFGQVCLGAAEPAWDQHPEASSRA